MMVVGGSNKVVDHGIDTIEIVNFTLSLSILLIPLFVVVHIHVKSIDLNILSEGIDSAVTMSKLTYFASERLIRVANATNCVLFSHAYLPHHSRACLGKGHQFISIHANVQCMCMHGTSHGSKLVYYNGNSHVFMGSVL